MENLLTNEETRKLPSAGKIVDLANYLSIVRATTARQLAERYDVSRATIFRYLNILYDVRKPLNSKNTFCKRTVKCHENYGYAI